MTNLYIVAQTGIPWADLSPVVAVGLIFLVVLLALLKHNASREKLMSEALDRLVAAQDRSTDSHDFIGRILAVHTIGVDALMRLVAKPRGVNVDDVMREARASADAKLGPLDTKR